MGLLDPNESGYKGFRDYTPRFLKAYDPWVLGFMAPRVWKMGVEPGLEAYRKHIGHRHLDVGPGTGYFIAESQPPEDIELTLVDANPHVLDHCSDRLATWEPRTIVANVLEPLPVKGPFDSAGLAHVIHCLPGPMAAKARAIEHIAAVLTHDGVLFGGTVLGLSAEHTWLARSFLRLANLQGGFDNREDNVDGLQTILEASFQEVVIDIPTGSVAYFVASRPRRLPSAEETANSLLAGSDAPISGTRSSLISALDPSPPSPLRTSRRGSGEMENQGLAASTIVKAWQITGAVLRLAVRDGPIARTPARDVELPASHR